MTEIPDEGQQIPNCIHDKSYTVQEKTEQEMIIRYAYCDSCHNLLWVEEFNTASMIHHRKIMDDVYETLYTRKGRAVLIREALMARGWEIPTFWGDKMVKG